MWRLENRQLWQEGSLERVLTAKGLKDLPGWEWDGGRLWEGRVIHKLPRRQQAGEVV